MAQKQILIVCGEPSGDLHAATLAKAIISAAPDTKIFGVGGDRLRAAGTTILYDIKGLAVLGFFDVLKKLPQFFALKKLILKQVSRINPDLVILIDFSGFNLRLAKALNNSVPIFYYISPQLWASREGRIRSIKRYIRKMIVLFKFEEEFYRRHGIDVAYVGHPLLDIVKPTLSKKQFLAKFSLSGSKKTIVLLPGSREQEIRHILPVMLKACTEISHTVRHPQCIIAKAPNLSWDIFNRITKGTELDLEVIEEAAYDCLNAADFCLVCSGTATVETAILKRPFVIVYKMNHLNYQLYRPQVKIPYIGMVNIIAGEEIIPEFIQDKATAHAIAQKVISILSHPAELTKMGEDLNAVVKLLGEPGAAQRAGRIIAEFLNRHSPLQ